MEADLHDLTAAYALDALDPDEAREYEAHLARCERCRAERALDHCLDVDVLRVLRLVTRRVLVHHAR
jgi:anti-sigma factor RsiW